MTAFPRAQPLITKAEDFRDCLPPLAVTDIDSLTRRSTVQRLITRPFFRKNGGLKPSADIAREIYGLPTGGWRISHATASTLAALAEATAPSCVLEFGSGVSTVLFGLLAARSRHHMRVVSIEEKQAYADRTMALAAAYGVSDHISVVVSPVVERIIEGWDGFMYAPDDSAIASALAGLKVEFIFIDGPASWLKRRGDCRFGTLLAARAWAAGTALFMADDALRGRDLSILRRWRTLPYVDLLGVIPVGRGLGAGFLYGPET